MWLGLVSIVLLGILMTIALVPDRMRVHSNYPAFKYWHRVVAIATLATATYHIVASNFYLGTWYQASLFVLLAIAASVGRAWWIRLGQIPIVNNATFLAVSAIFGALFVAIRNMPP